MKRRDAILALRSAQLEKGHLRNTRICYRGWLVRYMDGAAALLQAGANIREIQRQLGHEHVETTEIYLHATAKDGLVSPLDMPPPAAQNVTPIRLHA